MLPDPVYRQVPTGRAKGRPHSNKRRPGSVTIGLFVLQKSRFSHRSHVGDLPFFRTAQLFKFKTDQANDMKLIEKLNKAFCCLMSAPQPTVDLLIGLLFTSLPKSIALFLIAIHAFSHGQVTTPYANGVFTDHVTINDHDIFHIADDEKKPEEKPVAAAKSKGRR